MAQATLCGKVVGARGLPVQVTFLNDFNMAIFHVHQMYHRFLIQSARGFKGQAEAEIISAQYENATPPVE